MLQSALQDWQVTAEVVPLLTCPAGHSTAQRLFPPASVYLMKPGEQASHVVAVELVQF